ncbi:hypothetical protein WA026_009527 [Henosepilachna vigintioctopunctata]|uniref:Uncharacterized protein n=1 Tax=Henosepilachna vigintioctopunctata TaxID=420089 RepID=A0AAW1U8T1_9CUCU
MDNSSANFDPLKLHHDRAGVLCGKGAKICIALHSSRLVRIPQVYLRRSAHTLNADGTSGAVIHLHAPSAGVKRRERGGKGLLGDDGQSILRSIQCAGHVGAPRPRTDGGTGGTIRVLSARTRFIAANPNDAVSGGGGRKNREDSRGIRPSRVDGSN